MSFIKEINFSYKDPQSKSPVFSLMTLIEENSIQALKGNIYKNFISYSKNNYDYVNLWKNLIGKSILNQSALLLNDLCFYHDLSVIMAAFQTSDDIQVNLMGYLETIKGSLNAFLQYVKESKLKENSQKLFNFSFYAQFILQILNYIDIIKHFISKKVESISCFEYFSLPKFSFEVNRLSLEQISKKNSNIFFKNIIEKSKNLIQNYVYSTIPNLSGSSDLFNFLVANYQKEELNIEISLMCFHYKLNYGFEIAQYQNKFYSCFISKKLIMNLASAFSMMDAALIKGCSASGKQETLKVFKYFLNFLFNFK